MIDLKKFEKNKIYVLRKEPKKIYSFIMISILNTIILTILCICLRYSKNKNYLSMVILNEDIVYLETEVSNKDFDFFKTDNLIIDNKKYNFNIDELNETDNGYKIVLEVFDYKPENEKYVLFSLQTEKTTIFKEICKKIKEDLNY